MTKLGSRSSTLAGRAGVVLLGALAPLALIGVAGGGGSLGWVALAGGAACASGLVLGTTQRLLPALSLALIAAAASALAATAGGSDGVRELAFPAAATVGDARPRADSGPADGGAREQVAHRRGAREAPPPTPARFVRRFYANLEAGRFEAAWARLAPAVQARFTSFDTWRSGYDSTLTQRVEHVRLEPGGLVRHDLVTVDRTPCGTTTERRFEVLWRLAPTARGFTATALYDVQLAGLDPDYAC